MSDSIAEIRRLEAESKRLQAELDELQSTRSLKNFMSDFGNEQGAIYYRDGKSYLEATVAHFGVLKAENIRLRKVITSMESGEEHPVSDNDDYSASGGRRNRGDGIAGKIKFAK